MTERIRVVDSHTAGEPTRVVIEGGPDLGVGPMAERRERFLADWDHYRSAIVNEPRGSDVLVGALLLSPYEPDCDAGVIFFNNVGMLGMCGHGTIGVVETLRHLGRIRPGAIRLDTPVGVVTATLEDDGRGSLRNVASYRHAAGVRVSVPGHGEVAGDVAYGGNWFFLVQHDAPLEIEDAACLTAHTWSIRQALASQGVTGRDCGQIDHVELFGPSEVADSKNFVLCPGMAYDRSPCGTGTSAKLACLYADGKLKPGEVWRQESICGGIFEGWVEVVEGDIYPHIRGRAHVTAESTLLLDQADPYRWGIGR